MPNLTTPRTWSEMFPKSKGIVMNDGHIDRITGPRCMVKMSEGEFVGRYVIAHTTAVLSEGTEVLVDNYTGRAEVA